MSLQARPNCRVLFVPAEITTYCFYPGLQKDFMVANAIFRMVRARAGASLGQAAWCWAPMDLRFASAAGEAT